MNKKDSAFNRMFNGFKEQEYYLKKLDENEIHVKGIPTITSFMFFILILIGSILFIIGLLSVTLTEPEWISGSLFMLAGLFLILLPFQNYYSKKGFEIKINKPQKRIIIKSFTFFPNKKIISFDDINNILIKETLTNTFVDDTSESSTLQNYIVELNMNNNEKESLLRFFRKNEYSEVFMKDFSKLLADFLNKEKKNIVIS